MRLDALTPDERARGVVAASAGNHGLGLAEAGRALGICVEVVVPNGTSEIKRQGIIARGAQLVVAGAGYDEAEAIARSRAAERGATFVSAFDDPHVIRGNGGTLGEEIRAQLPQVERVLCPVGGGGMVSGLAAALCPQVQVVGAQPAQNCAMHDSLARGTALVDYAGAPTMAEGCEGGVAQQTFELCRRYGVKIELVSEAAIASATTFAYRTLDLVVEPTAAVALAAVRAHPSDARTVVVVSGGNIARDKLDTLLAEHRT